MTAPIVNDELLTRGKVVVVGLGGIGSISARYLALFLASLDKNIDMMLVDGDKFEPNNLYRMEVDDFAEKAQVMAKSLSRSFGSMNLSIKSVSKYLTEENVEDIIEDGDVVLSCVDNHATRKLISKRCEQLNNCILVSAGNDGVEDGMNGTQGNTQLMRREGGETIWGAELTRYHPEIENPADTTPDALDCMESVAAGAPQLLFTNLYAASTMLNGLLRILWPTTKNCFDEVCFDILEGISVPKWISASDKDN